MSQKMVCPYSSVCPKKPAKTVSQSGGDRCYHKGPHEENEYCERVCGLSFGRKQRSCVHYEELESELFEI
jgi:hypothetical protein